MRPFFLSALAACAPSPLPGDVPPEVAPEDATLVEASVRCDPQAARWSFQLEADAWTGGARLWWSADGAYRERHGIPSVGAPRDGTGDTLRSSLDIAVSWTEAASGARTAFPCRTPDLAGVLQLLSLDGERVTDCLGFGEAPGRWADWDQEVACERVLESETQND